MRPEEYVAHARHLYEELPPLSEGLVVLAVVVVSIAWVLAFLWAERH